MKLKVVIHPEPEGGYSVAAPALPGCFSCGDTPEAALANIREAALGWIEVANERQPFAPEDRSTRDRTAEIE